jgi:ribosome biogenesis GTPase
VCIHDWGFCPDFASQFSSHAEAGFEPARVVSESNEIYRLMTAAGERHGELAGRLRYGAEDRQDLPAVGDWVAVQLFGPDPRDPAIIHAVLPRRSCLVRKAAGRRTAAQVVAANVDTVFLVTSLNQDFNPRRLERYLALVRDGGAVPVVLLAKADLVDEARVHGALEAVRTALPGVPAFAVSSLSGEGLDGLAPYLPSGATVALLGSSGVGKSTLVNRLLGEERQAVETFRESDGRGRHTTTRRQLIPLPGGAVLLDTPGMRELALWGGGEEGAGAAFAEIESLAQACRFPDCQHATEPGCAVRAAVEAGDLPPGRLESYEKLLKEEAYLEARKADGATLRARHKATARLHKAVQQHSRRHKRFR